MRSPRPPSRSHPTCALAVAVLAAAMAAAPAASAQSPSRTYLARPAPVLACGGVDGECRVLTIEGSIEVAWVPRFPNAPEELVIRGSDLLLRTLDGVVVAPFPSPGDLPLTELVRLSDRDYDSPAGAAQTVRLDVSGGRDLTFGFSGSYDEGCCGRFRYELGGVTFDFLGSDSEAPTLHLRRGEFRIAVDWIDRQGGRGAGTPIPFDFSSGRFWFFRPDNPELLVKVIDACEPFGFWWFFAAGLTDLGVEIRVDGPGGSRVYTRPAGEPFAPILDTEALPCPPPEPW